MNKVVKTFQYGEHQVSIETGEIARQATASVIVRMDSAVLLVTVVAQKEAIPGRPFFPLTVSYAEKTYSVGKIPGGYFKREGRPTESEILICRLIDRPIRPLFPKDFKNEVQVVATLLSLDPEINPDIPALIGASAALSLSGIPFAGPIGAARVGYTDGEFVLNPTNTQLESSQLNLVVAGTESAVLMVESEAKILPEKTMLDAVMFGQQQMQTVIKNIKELVEEAGNPPWKVEPPVVNETLLAQLKEGFTAKIEEAYQIKDKLARQTMMGELRDQALEKFSGEEEGQPSTDEVKGLFAKIEKDIVRDRIIRGERRIDGRDTRTVRPITIQNRFLPRTHGSALFTRGETQAIVVATLGTGRDAQIIDALAGERKDHFMLHYNFPPYCVGETGMMMGPKRREIGHGRLARRAMEAVLPTNEEFPYVIRVVSEITESNGSSSMATVCGASLSLMDAGVPIKAPVAGIAMGLVKDGNKFAVLSDILGDEDHLGDMDFKVAGTSEGITALQMDIKIDGITEEIMQLALAQAKEGRLHILGEMSKVITKPNAELSEFAPRIITMKVHPDKIREVIGKGGATIRSITEETGVSMDINDDGEVKIYSADQAASELARKRVEEIVADAEIGKIYEGKIMKIVDFGAFVNILPGKDGLLHISQIREERVENVTDELAEGQVVRVKVLDVDRQGKIKLSMKEVEQEVAA